MSSRKGERPCLRVRSAVPWKEEARWGSDLKLAEFLRYGDQAARGGRSKTLLEAKIQTHLCLRAVKAIDWTWKLQRCEKWQLSHRCFHRGRGKGNLIVLQWERRDPVISLWCCQRGIPLFFRFPDGNEQGLIVSTPPKRELTFLLVCQENNLFSLFHSFSFSL